jgi:hypothetical protein
MLPSRCYVNPLGSGIVSRPLALCKFLFRYCFSPPPSVTIIKAILSLIW